MNKLMIFGDSILKGVTYSQDKKRYVLCEHSYIKALSQKGIIAENHSKMGATINKINEIIDKKISSIDENTFVLLGFGGNDSDYNWNEVSASPQTNHFPQTAIDTFFNKYCSLIEKVKSTGACVFVSNLVPLDSDKYMEWISNGKSYNNILSFLGDRSMLYRGQELFNQAVEQAAEDTDTPLFNIRRSFLRSHEYKSIICSDGIHPSKLGHEMIDNALFNYIEKSNLYSISA